MKKKTAREVKKTADAEKHAPKDLFGGSPRPRRTVVKKNAAKIIHIAYAKKEKTIQPRNRKQRAGTRQGVSASTQETFPLIILLYMLYILIMQNVFGTSPDFPKRPYVALAAVFFLALLLPVIVTGWPMDFLEIQKTGPGVSGEGKIIFHTPVLLGRGMTNTIIHSVQLTPVIDEYRVQEGRIWAWREKILSHNAGLPSLKPERGRFVYDPPWMIVEGTGAAWNSFIYRVGTEALGKNELCVFPHPCRELWKEMPGARLIFQVVASGT